MDIRPIQYQGPDFAEWLDLRYRVLRLPLGLTFSAADIAAEGDQIHICAFKEDQVIVGGLILVPQVEQIKMRQVAVEPSLQRSGVGTQLVKYVEEYSAENQHQMMSLHARETAVPFYLRLGYAIVGDCFEEVGLPHYKMKKHLV